MTARKVDRLIKATFVGLAFLSVAYIAAIVWY